jgi:hypothetical protein
VSDSCSGTRCKSSENVPKGAFNVKALAPNENKVNEIKKKIDSNIIHVAGACLLGLPRRLSIAFQEFFLFVC